MSVTLTQEERPREDIGTHWGEIRQNAKVRNQPIKKHNPQGHQQRLLGNIVRNIRIRFVSTMQPTRKRRQLRTPSLHLNREAFARWAHCCLFRCPQESRQNCAGKELNDGVIPAFSDEQDEEEGCGDVETQWIQDQMHFELRWKDEEMAEQLVTEAVVPR